MWTLALCGVVSCGSGGYRSSYDAVNVPPAVAVGSASNALARYQRLVSAEVMSVWCAPRMVGSTPATRAVAVNAAWNAVGTGGGAGGAEGATAAKTSCAGAAIDIIAVCVCVSCAISYEASSTGSARRGEDTEPTGLVTRHVTKALYR